MESLLLKRIEGNPEESQSQIGVLSQDLIEDNTFKGYQLVFQINFEEISDPRQRLPRKGILRCLLKSDSYRTLNQLKIEYCDKDMIDQQTYFPNFSKPLQQKTNSKDKDYIHLLFQDITNPLEQYLESINKLHLSRNVLWAEDGSFTYLSPTDGPTKNFKSVLIDLMQNNTSPEYVEDLKSFESEKQAHMRAYSSRIGFIRLSGLDEILFLNFELSISMVGLRDQKFDSFGLYLRN